jgi:23S rRNA (cytidine2498-2'-O)-methyltransferase
METGQVTYCPEDGFKFQPKKKNIYWLVCDMIEQPQKVAKLMANWVADGRCKEAMFNLKLPMKKRYESVQGALGIIDEVMQANQVGKYLLQAKHLYHNREEVTVHLRLK